MPELDVDADLRLRVTTPTGGSTNARITGAGRELLIDVDQPEVLLAAVDVADVGRAADLLAATGMTVRVIGPDGLAATIGAGSSSRLGKIATGSAAVQVTPRGAARAALTLRTRRAALVVPVGMLIVAMVLVAVVRRRYRR